LEAHQCLEGSKHELMNRAHNFSCSCMFESLQLSQRLAKYKLLGGKEVDQAVATILVGDQSR